MRKGETYLGDGLYCRFDGDQICLRTARDNGDHYVYLQPRMLAEVDDLVRSLHEIEANLEAARQKFSDDPTGGVPRTFL